MPLREYLCTYCDHLFEEFVTSRNPEDYRTAECRCGSTAEVLPASISGVNGVALSNARPKTRVAGKVFTGPKDIKDSSEAQLDFGFTQNGIDGKDVD